MRVIAQTDVSNQPNNDFYVRLGYTLEIGYSVWTFLTLILILIVHDKELSVKFKILTYGLYTPSRLGFLVWGPWLSYEVAKHYAFVK